MKMRINAEEHGQLVVEEVFNSLILRTSEGNELAVCMRDDTIEMKVPKFDLWYRVDMTCGEIRLSGRR